MSTVFVFVMNVCSFLDVISICCSEFYFAVTVVGHRNVEREILIIKRSNRTFPSPRNKLKNKALKSSNQMNQMCSKRKQHEIIIIA